jgi:hypothetical protein
MGITIYRDKSRRQQVLNLGVLLGEEGNGEIKKGKEHEHSYVVMDGDEGICPDCRTPMVFADGCATCPNCSYSYCSVG